MILTFTSFFAGLLMHSGDDWAPGSYGQYLAAISAGALLLLLATYRTRRPVRKRIHVWLLYGISAAMLYGPGDVLVAAVLTVSAMYLSLLYRFYACYSRSQAFLSALAVCTMYFFAGIHRSDPVTGVVFPMFYSVLFARFWVDFRQIDRILGKLRQVHRRERPVRAEFDQGKGIPSFTSRQQEIAKLLCLELLSDKEIASRMGISLYSVVNNLRRMRMKTGTRDRLQLVRYLAPRCALPIPLLPLEYQKLEKSADAHESFWYHGIRR